MTNVPMEMESFENTAIGDGERTQTIILNE